MVKYIIIGGYFYGKKEKRCLQSETFNRVEKKNIIVSLLQEYDTQFAQDIQVALCALLGELFNPS